MVLVTQQASDDALHRELTADPDALAAAGIGGVFLIGDALAPRMISEAIFDGHRLGREIDRPDPARPAPYRRELPDPSPPTRDDGLHAKTPAPRTEAGS